MSRQPITTLDLMRHGEPVGGRRYRGQTDDPLSEKGWAQMRNAVGDHCPWQAVISSSLSRCADFARELAKRRQLPLDIDARLIELGFGTWEGRTPDELTAADPEILNRFRHDPVTHAPAGAETLTAFRDRVISAWDSLLERHAGKHVLVVAHAGVIRMVVAHVLNVPLQHLFRLQVPNAGITRIRVEKHGGQLFPQLLFHGGNL
ncbi:MAG TPA: alpha-ribazole phosphatase family protein [Sulfuricaulis sp.]|nr:alpha-ribazole phosphatase family protein [Sulfuricaulis sp.]